MRQEVLPSPDSPTDGGPQMANMRKVVTRTWTACYTICDCGEVHLKRTVRVECEQSFATGLRGTLTLPQAAANDIMSSKPHYPDHNVTLGADLCMTDTSER